jgi:CTP:molybdopterin cytidylyltransferase MocA
MTVAGVVLAAGGGSRFSGGTHKLLAVLRGRPVIAWSLEAAVAAGFSEVILVTGAVDIAAAIAGVMQSAQVPVREVQNPDWASGQASSLQAAVRAAEAADHTAIVVGLGDQPDVGPSAWRAVGASRGPIVAATFAGDRRPPVKLERTVWQLLPTTGDDGARILMRDHPGLVSELPCPGDPRDIDTEHDLLAAGGAERRDRERR